MVWFTSHKSTSRQEDLQHWHWSSSTVVFTAFTIKVAIGIDSGCIPFITVVDSFAPGYSVYQIYSAVGAAVRIVLNQASFDIIPLNSELEAGSEVTEGVVGFIKGISCKDPP